MSNTILTIPCRLSYAKIWEPTTDDKGNKKFSAMLLIPKTDKKTIKSIEDAIQAAKLEKFGDKAPKNLPTTFNDGDETADNDEKYDSLRGYMTLNVNTDAKRPLDIVKKKDGVIHAITNQDEVYSGCWCYVTVTLKGYDIEVAGAKKKGIGSYLGPILKWKNDTKLGGGGVTAATAFADKAFDTEEEKDEEEFA